MYKKPKQTIKVSMSLTNGCKHRKQNNEKERMSSLKSGGAASVCVEAVFYIHTIKTFTSVWLSTGTSLLDCKLLWQWAIGGGAGLVVGDTLGLKFLILLLW